MSVILPTVFNTHFYVCSSKNTCHVFKLLKITFNSFSVSDNHLKMSWEKWICVSVKTKFMK